MEQKNGQQAHKPHMYELAVSVTTGNPVVLYHPINEELSKDEFFEGKVLDATLLLDASNPKDFMEALQNFPNFYALHSSPLNDYRPLKPRGGDGAKITRIFYGQGVARGGYINQTMSAVEEYGYRYQQTQENGGMKRSESTCEAIPLEEVVSMVRLLKYFSVLFLWMKGKFELSEEEYTYIAGLILKLNYKSAIRGACCDKDEADILIDRIRTIAPDKVSGKSKDVLIVKATLLFFNTFSDIRLKYEINPEALKQNIDFRPSESVPWAVESTLDVKRGFATLCNALAEGITTNGKRGSVRACSFCGRLFTLPHSYNRLTCCGSVKKDLARREESDYYLSHPSVEELLHVKHYQPSNNCLAQQNKLRRKQGLKNPVRSPKSKLFPNQIEED